MTDQGVSLERLRERLEREPCAGAMHLLAETYYQQGHYSQAVETSRRALSLYPENPELRLLLGQSLVALGEFAEAEEILKPVVQEIQRLGEVFHTLHHLYGGQGRAAAAEQSGRLYRFLQEALDHGLLKGAEALAPPVSPPAAAAARQRRHLTRTLEVLEKWQQALQSL